MSESDFWRVVARIEMIVQSRKDAMFYLYFCFNGRSPYQPAVSTQRSISDR